MAEPSVGTKAGFSKTSQSPKTKPAVAKKVSKSTVKYKKPIYISPVLAIVTLLCLITLGASIFFATQYIDARNKIAKLSNPTDTTKAEQNKLVATISVLTPLPTGETPTFAEVVDATKLSNQPFFVNAQNGDKVLIYTKAKKAILYRPSTNKIINIAPVNLGSGQTTQ